MVSAGQPAFLLTHKSDQGSDQHYLYAWGLAHYLMLGESLLEAKQMDQYVRREAAQLDPAVRLQLVVKQSLPEFERRWRKWASGGEKKKRGTADQR